jgi:hypothetical protein
MTNSESAEPVNTSAVDLTQFCDLNAIHRPFLMEPWSRGEYSYASDGAILVRVPRQPDVAENPNAPDAVNNFAGDIDYTDPAIPELPPENREQCRKCDGDGGVCGDCEDCDGRGYTTNHDDLSVELSGTPFAARYLHRVLALPGVAISKPFNGSTGAMLAFRFEGGEGRLMALRAPSPVHMRAGETYKQAAREAHRRDCLAAVEALTKDGYLQRIDDRTFRIADEWRGAATAPAP